MRTSLLRLRPRAAGAAPKRGDTRKGEKARDSNAKTARNRDQNGFQRNLRNRGFNQRRGAFHHFGHSVQEPPATWSRYVRVSDVARRILGTASVPLARDYRARFDSASKTWLERIESAPAAGAETIAELLRLAELYPITDSGLRARELAADYALESGDWTSAIESLHPLVSTTAVMRDVLANEREPDNARLVTKYLGALAHAVDSPAGVTRFEFERSRLLATISNADARARVALALTEIPLETGMALETGSSDREESVQRAASRWGGELVGGSTSDSPRPSTLTQMGFETSWQTLSWLRDVVVRDLHDDPSSYSHFGRAIISRSIDHPFIPLSVPSEDGDQVFLSGVYELFQIDGRVGTGKILRQGRKPAPSLLKHRFREASDSPLYTATLWDRDLDRSSSDRVLSGLETLPDRLVITHYLSNGVRRDHFMGYAITAEVATRSLLAVDPKNGQSLWRTNDLRRSVRRDRMGPSDIPVHISYSSPAVVRGGRVFAAGWRQKGYIDAMVRALDVRTGRKIWETSVCSSQMEQTMFGELAREPFASFLLEEEGVLYFLSNLGSIAALSAETGAVLWSTTYDYLRPEPTLGKMPRLRDLVWSNNPPILLGNVLVVAPRDSTLLLAIDTGRGPRGASAAGEVVWYYDNSGGRLRDMLGYHEGRLYFTGEDGVEGLDLSSMNAEGRLVGSAASVVPGRSAPSDAEEGEAVSDGVAGAGRSSFPGRELLATLPRPKRLGKAYGGSPGEEGVAAAGCLTRDGILYCDETGLYLVDHALENQKAIVLPARVDENDPDAGGIAFPMGRVSIVGDLILVTSQTRITAYGAPVY